MKGVSVNPKFKQVGDAVITPLIGIKFKGHQSYFSVQQWL